MIEQKDLRLGNYVNSKLLGSNHKITGLLNDMLYTDLQLSYSEYEDWQPIELTPEILDNCGWGKSDEHEIGTNMLNENNDGLYFDYHFKRFRMDFGGNADIRMPHIQYLHQLQNLFYSLTGDELEIVW